jgi:hypothetical protein
MLTRACCDPRLLGRRLCKALFDVGTVHHLDDSIGDVEQ